MRFEEYAITVHGQGKPSNDNRIMIGDAVISAGRASHSGGAPMYAVVFDGTSNLSSDAAASAFLDDFGRADMAGVLGKVKGVVSNVEKDAEVDVGGARIAKDGMVTVFSAGSVKVMLYRNGILADAAEGLGNTNPLGSIRDVSVVAEDIGVLEAGDILFGCSVGLSRFLKDDMIGQLLSQGMPLPAAANTLLDMAFRNGSDDDISFFLLAPEEDAFDDVVEEADEPVDADIEEYDDSMPAAEGGEVSEVGSSSHSFSFEDLVFESFDDDEE